MVGGHHYYKHVTCLNVNMSVTNMSVKLLVLLSVHTLTACGGGGVESIDSSDDPADNLVSTITSTAFQTQQNSELMATLTASDAESESILFSQTSEPDSGVLVTFSAKGGFTYRPNTGFSGSYSFMVTVSDGTNEVFVRITIKVNEAPSFTSGNTNIVDENTSGVVYPTTASDAGIDILSFSLSGADQAVFSLNGTTGERAIASAL